MQSEREIKKKNYFSDIKLVFLEIINSCYVYRSWYNFSLFFSTNFVNFSLFASYLSTFCWLKEGGGDDAFSSPLPKRRAWLW